LTSGHMNLAFCTNWFITWIGRTKWWISDD